MREKPNDEESLLTNDFEPSFIKSNRNSKRIYLVLEVTPAILCVCGILVLILLSYPFWPSASHTDSSPVVLQIPNETPIQTFSESKTKSPEKPKFLRPPGTENLKCEQLFDEESNYTKEMKKARITFKDPTELDMSCEAIRSRRIFPTEPSSIEEANFPVARARIVYTDYYLLEMELAAAYQPQNHYCFSIDAKADKIFHERVRRLANCFPNVFTTQHEFRVDGAGHNMGPAFLECLTALAKPEKPWKYVHLLQNHDSSLRTNLETVRILQWMNGSNDVEITQMPGGRVDTSLDWSFEALHLFRNETRNKTPFNGYEPKLIFSKGYVESTLSRGMVDFMLNVMNLTELVKRIETKSFGIDEIMIPTLHAADALASPGGFTHKCYDEKVHVSHITRFSLQNDLLFRKSVWNSGAECGSKHMRHAICIFGVEDLERISLMRHFFVNKIMPSFDFAAVTCWYEKLFNRTHVDPPTTSRLNPHFYLNLAHVRFQYLKDSNGVVSAEKLKNFQCGGKTGII